GSDATAAATAARRDAAPTSLHGQIATDPRGALIVVAEAARLAACWWLTLDPRRPAYWRGTIAMAFRPWTCFIVLSLLGLVGCGGGGSSGSSGADGGAGGESGASGVPTLSIGDARVTE